MVFLEATHLEYRKVISVHSHQEIEDKTTFTICFVSKSNTLYRVLFFYTGNNVSIGYFLIKISQYNRHLIRF